MENSGIYYTQYDGNFPLIKTVMHYTLIMKKIPTVDELQESFNDFSLFTFELIEKANEDTKYLKFAAVNSQISLELFLKYLFAKQNKVNEIRKKRNSKLTNDFQDFSQILNHYYAKQKWTYGSKKEFKKLIETRNSIVHKGYHSLSTEELAIIIVRTIFFIHSTAWSQLDEYVLSDNYLPHKISENKFWRKGVEKFIDELIELNDYCEVLTCMACKTYSVVGGEDFALEEYHFENHRICLNCLTSIDISHEARIIECYNCYEESYLIDALNEQNDQLYIAKCSECNTDTFVRKCPNCDTFYHPDSPNEKKYGQKYFCSENCAIIFCE